MALSKCGSCGKSTFEIKEANVSGSNYRQFFVQCRSCGVPIAVQGFYNTGAQLEEHKKKIDEINRRLQRVEAAVGNIDSNIVRLSKMIQR